MSTPPIIIKFDKLAKSQHGMPLIMTDHGYLPHVIFLMTWKIYHLILSICTDKIIGPVSHYLERFSFTVITGDLTIVNIVGFRPKICWYQTKK